MIVGIEETTGLVARDGEFRVPGTVTVRRGAWLRVHHARERIDLQRCGVVPVAPRPVAPRPTAVPHLSVEASGA